MCKECGCEQSKKEKHEKRAGNNSRITGHSALLAKSIVSDINKTIKEKKQIKTEINKSLKEENDKIAKAISDFLLKQNIFCINIMGAPGAGKTTLIQGISCQLNQKEVAVIQGDLESDIDQEHLRKAGIDCFQINTHSGCHLNSVMLNKAVLDMKKKGMLNNKKFLIIENVGNLVCPAGVKIGQHIDIVISATTEGFDKPKKYPIIFLDAKAVVISKLDLAGYADFNEKEYIESLKNIAPKTQIFKTSSKNTESYKAIADFISHERKHFLCLSH